MPKLTFVKLTNVTEMSLNSKWCNYFYMLYFYGIYIFYIQTRFFFQISNLDYRDIWVKTLEAIWLCFNGKLEIEGQPLKILRIQFPEENTT